MTEIAVSIDSPTKPGFESIRKGASFDRVVKNVSDLIALRDGRYTISDDLSPIPPDDNPVDLLFEAHEAGELAQVDVTFKARR